MLNQHETKIIYNFQDHPTNIVIRFQCNAVVSNHFHSVKFLLFSSVRSRDFDGMLSAELLVSMYTTKTPNNMYRFTVRSST